MRRFNGLAGDHNRLAPVHAVGVDVVMVATLAVGNAFAASVRSPATKLCIPKAAGKSVKTPGADRS
jgi:hypothetical protein